MQQSQINRVVKLIKKTGDKIVLMDNESDAVMMLMDLDSYEVLLAKPAMVQSEVSVEKLTEEELMEKINKDVAVWRAHNDKERLETIDKVLEKNTFLDESASRRENYLRPAQSVHADQDAGSGKPVEKVLEGSAADIEDEEEEEKFYLEPVE